MADIKLYTGANPVIELTGVKALGTENIKSANVATGKTLQNGMLVGYTTLTETADLPSGATAEVWLHASVEKLYGVQETRADFKVEAGKGFLARLYRLRKGMEFETNAIIYDNAKFADVAAIKAAIATGVYVIPDATGLGRLTKQADLAATSAVNYGQVKEVVTLPNGEVGIAYEIVKVVA